MWRWRSPVVGLGGRRPAVVAGGRAKVKLSPVTLPASGEVRLRRVAPGATYQPDLHRLLVPMEMPAHGSEFAPALVALLAELLPPAG